MQDKRESIVVKEKKSNLSSSGSKDTNLGALQSFWFNTLYIHNGDNGLQEPPYTITHDINIHFYFLSWFHIYKL